MKTRCEFCKKVFDKKKADIKRTNHNLCSKKCRGSFYANDDTVLKDKFVRVSSGCHEFTGYKDRHGYGVLRYMKTPMLAHRVSYLINFGAIEDGKHVLHICDNPKCINPDHLFAGTPSDNMQDMFMKDRGHAKLKILDVKYIKLSGHENKTLAKMFGVSERTIRYAKQKEHWKSAQITKSLIG